MQYKNCVSMLGSYLIIALATTLIPTQAHGVTEKTLYNFKVHDGDDPDAALVLDTVGNLYGTTALGGAHRFGAVFELSPNGAGGWNETVLYSFTGGTDGSSPLCNLIFDTAGNLYGTAQKSGTYGFGTVFELSPNGAGAWNQTVLYSFTGGTDGANPISGLTMDSSGNLYGATFKLGVKSGTIFELSPSGGEWAESTIYQASALSAVIFDSTGNLYGTSAFGGTFGQGYVYELSPNPHGGWTPTVLYNFKASKDGHTPDSALKFDAAGNLYGTTTLGGAYNKGAVFKLTRNLRRRWQERLLHSFQGEPNDGYYPEAGVVFDAAGNIFGTTDQGGANNYFGTVFELTPQPTGIYKEKVLWNFAGTDGDVPSGGLILDKTGNLYGTAQSGGTRTAGVVFEVTP